MTPKVDGPLIMTKHLEYILTVIFAKYKIAPSQVMATLNGCRGPVLAVVGLCWPSLAVVGLH